MIAQRLLMTAFIVSVCISIAYAQSEKWSNDAWNMICNDGANEKLTAKQQYVSFSNIIQKLEALDFSNALSECERMLSAYDNSSDKISKPILQNTHKHIMSCMNLNKKQLELLQKCNYFLDTYDRNVLVLSHTSLLDEIDKLLAEIKAANMHFNIIYMNVIATKASILYDLKKYKEAYTIYTSIESSLVSEFGLYSPTHLRYLCIKHRYGMITDTVNTLKEVNVVLKYFSLNLRAIHYDYTSYVHRIYSCIFLLNNYDNEYAKPILSAIQYSICTDEMQETRYLLVYYCRIKGGQVYADVYENQHKSIYVDLIKKDLQRQFIDVVESNDYLINIDSAEACTARKQRRIMAYNNSLPLVNKTPSFSYLAASADSIYAEMCTLCLIKENKDKLNEYLDIAQGRIEKHDLALRVTELSEYYYHYTRANRVTKNIELKSILDSLLQYRQITR